MADEEKQTSKENDNLERPWLVKTSSKIIGPLTQEEVALKIIAGEISVVDEICLSYERWHYVREEKIFLEAVQELRRKLNEMPDVTMTATAHTDTELDEITDIYGVRAPSQEIVDEIEQSQNIDSNTLKIDVNGNRTTELKTYGASRDKGFQKKAQRNVHWHWQMIFASLVVLLIVGLGVFRFVPSVFIREHSSNWEIWFRRGVEAYADARYFDALEAFKKADSLYPDHVEIQSRMAPLMIVLEGRTVEGVRILEKILSGSDLRRLNVLEMKTAMALAKMLDEHWNEAEKILREVLLIEPNHSVALVNLAEVKVMKNEWAEAEKYFRSATEGMDRSPAIQILKTLARIKQSQLESNSQLLEETRDNLLQFAQVTFDYRSEAFLLLAEIENILGEEVKAANFAFDFLSSDPEMTEEHGHDLFLYKKPLSWETLFSYCEDLLKRKENHDHILQAAVALCAIQAEQSQLIQNFVNESPAGDSLAQAVQAYYLRTLGKESESNASLQIALRDPSLKLAQIVKARNCFDHKDWLCARKYWLEIFDRDNRALDAVAYLGLVEYYQNHPELARRYLDIGLGFSPRYIPLKQLQTLMMTNK